MVNSYKLYTNGQHMKVYVLTIYMILVDCDDIILGYHLQLDVACEFIYAINESFVVHVGCNLVLVANWNFSSSVPSLNLIN
jgi:hypothetical protein